MQRSSSSNKGFSLVELIIVISIMMITQYFAVNVVKN